jgi:hypothetical protein
MTAAGTRDITVHAEYQIPLLESSTTRQEGGEKHVCLPRGDRQRRRNPQTLRPPARPADTSTRNALASGEMDDAHQDYPAMLAVLEPMQAVEVLNARVKHVGTLNSEIADWLQVSSPWVSLSKPEQESDTKAEASLEPRLITVHHASRSHRAGTAEIGRAVLGRSAPAGETTPSSRRRRDGVSTRDITVAHG